MKSEVLLCSRCPSQLRGTISGCDGYLVKPLNELELVKVIAEFDPGFMARAGESVVA